MTRPGPGKFEGNESLEVSEYLYAIIGDSMQDDEIGEADQLGWYALITDADKHIPLDFITIKDVKPAYIVCEDNDGFFTYREFDLNTQARRVWRDIVRVYTHGMEGVSVL